jgi:hypothetical protein
VLARQEAGEVEARLGVSADAYRRDGGARPWHGNDWHALLHRAAHQERAGVAHSGSARVGDQREGSAVQEPLQDRVGPARFVIRRQREEGFLLDAEVLEELAGVARVLGDHAVAGGEHLAGPRRQVLQVADRCRHHVQRHGSY